MNTAAAKALASALQEASHTLDDVITKIHHLYERHNKPPEALVDEIGREIGQTHDEWEARLGLAIALQSVMLYVDDEAHVMACLQFVLDKGVSDR